MKNEIVYGICERVEKYLRDNRVFCDVEPYGDEMPVVSVSIDWGDWKHEHLRCKWLMEEIGARFISSQVTEENGSDCYSAIHSFFVDGGILGGA